MGMTFRHQFMSIREKGTEMSYVESKAFWRVVLATFLSMALAVCGAAACVLYGRKKKAKEEEAK